MPFVVHGHAELGGQDDLLAPRAHDRAHVGLGATAAAIHVRCVEQGDAGVEGGVEHGLCAGFVQLHAEIVAAKPDSRDAQTGTAQIAVFHE